MEVSGFEYPENYGDLRNSAAGTLKLVYDTPFLRYFSLTLIHRFPVREPVLAFCSNIHTSDTSRPTTIAHVDPLPVDIICCAGSVVSLKITGK